MLVNYSIIALSERVQNGNLTSNTGADGLGLIKLVCGTMPLMMIFRSLYDSKYIYLHILRPHIPQVIRRARILIFWSTVMLLEALLNLDMGVTKYFRLVVDGVDGEMVNL